MKAGKCFIQERQARLSCKQVLQKQDTTTGTSEPTASESALEGPLEEATLEDNNQFYRWHSELEAARTLETEEKYKEYAASLRGNIKSLEAQLAKVTISQRPDCLSRLPFEEQKFDI